MGGKERGPLTEPMFYVLMSFLRQDRCGTEITEFVERRTHGRVRLGPGTLYTLLGKFQDEKLIVETEVDGRKRTYHLTDKGRAIYQDEVERLRTCVDDADQEEGLQ
ncbi:MAG: PadR family transcriptional regulator [Lawsonibacter sp.]|jgi:DNA-binding PadR family transcriptional regulator